MRAFVLGLLGVLLLGTAVQAAGGSRMESQYTDLDFDQCTMLETTEMGSMSACPGYRGYPVVVGEGDLRMFVSFGITPTVEKAMEQTLPPFNRLGQKVEWRIESDDDFWQPRATIVRWYTSRESGEAEGQVLVVTQLKPGATCHIAYIDALAVKNANEKAREIADKVAGRFDCAQEPDIVQPFKAFQPDR
jgi:hypothetical protein